MSSSVLELVWCSKVTSKSMPESRPQAQLLTVPDSVLPMVVPGLCGNLVGARQPGRTRMRVRCACGTLLAGCWGRERHWPEPRKTSHGLQVTRNGTIYRLILVGMSHSRAPAFRPDQRKACQAASQTHAQHIQTTLSHSWIEELRVTPWPLTCVTACMSITT